MTGPCCCHAGPRNHSSIMYPLNFEGVFIITLLYLQRSINLLISFHRTKGSTFVPPRPCNVKLAGKYLLSDDHRQYRNLLGHRLWGGTKLGHFITQLKNCISGWSKICHEKKICEVIWWHNSGSVGLLYLGTWKIRASRKSSHVQAPAATTASRALSAGKSAHVCENRLAHPRVLDHAKPRLSSDRGWSEGV